MTAKSPLDELDREFTQQLNLSDHDKGWTGPSELQVETMVWDMPIKVFATNPIHATSVSLLKSEGSCIL